MERVLAPEPLSLVAALMRLDAWPWAEAYLRGLPPARRLCLTSLLAAQAPQAPARDAFMLEQVSAAVRTCGPLAPVAVPRQAWSRLLPRVTTWKP
jgi:hypothetical protein